MSLSTADTALGDCGNELSAARLPRRLCDLERALTGDSAKTAFFAGNVSTTVLSAFLPASTLVIASGVGLTETGHWDWEEPFIAVGLVLWAIVSLVAFGFLARAMGAAAAQLTAEGPSPALGLRMRNYVWLSRVLLGILAVIVFLMTVKPGT